jgi:ribosomal protein S18 acetylase RimI-like enzyme
MQPAPSLEPVVSSRAVATSVRPATSSDIPALVKLINQAYEIEKFFVEEERTTEREVAALAEKGHFLVLDRGGAGLAGAVYVRIDGDRGYFGMLSVAPDLRGHGLGKRLVGVAEALCTALGCTAMDLRIVNLREELGPWYRSLGYHESGTAPYDHPSKLPCHFIRMSKELVQE